MSKILRTTGQSRIFPQFPRFWKSWLWPGLKRMCTNLKTSVLSSRRTEPDIPRRLLYCGSRMISIRPWIRDHAIRCCRLTFPRHSTPSTMTCSCGGWTRTSELLTLPRTGSSHTYPVDRVTFPSAATGRIPGFATAAFLKVASSDQLYSPPSYRLFPASFITTESGTINMPTIRNCTRKSTRGLASAPTISRAASSQSLIGFCWTGFNLTPTRLRPSSSVRDSSLITANNTVQWRFVAPMSRSVHVSKRSEFISMQHYPWTCRCLKQSKFATTTSALYVTCANASR